MLSVRKPGRPKIDYNYCRFIESGGYVFLNGPDIDLTPGNNVEVLTNHTFVNGEGIIIAFSESKFGERLVGKLSNGRRGVNISSKNALLKSGISPGVRYPIKKMTISLQINPKDPRTLVHRTAWVCKVKGGRKS